MRVDAGSFARCVVVGMSVGVGACSSPTSGLDAGADGAVERAVALEVRQGGGILLLTQATEPEVSMDALYTGPVTADAGGCLRLDTAEGVTVVWPKGFRARSSDGGTVIENAGGRAVGRVGDSFRLGGGEVPFLHEGLGFTPTDQELAASRCPGKFWIVAPGEVSSR